jgi:hypothetical protein
VLIPTTQSCSLRQSARLNSHPHAVDTFFKVMEIEGAASRLDNDIQVALQKRMLDAMRESGAQLNQLINSAPTPVRSVNMPWQGNYVDAQV